MKILNTRELIIEVMKEEEQDLRELLDFYAIENYKINTI
jgi:cell shape-determining protein MreC